MRMFAGPNGSGKSTLRDLMLPEWIGVYLNPDELEHAIRRDGHLDFGAYGVAPTDSQVRNFFQQSNLLQGKGLVDEARRLTLDSNRLDFTHAPVNAYFASVIADLIRRLLVDERRTFTFETVMSAPAKVAFMEHARSAGYRIYLYYIATDDPQINLSRVATRVSMGGHNVPDDKVVSRYYRSLDLLHDAILRSDRAYIFDNSGDQQGKTWLAESTNGHDLILRSSLIPAWFQKAVLDKFADC